MAADPLAEFFAASPRDSAGLSGRSGVQGDVDAALNDLRVPATLDADGDWRLQTDVGPFLLVLDKSNGDLVALQTIRRMEGASTDYADDMHVLLLLNLDANGACFAALRDGDVDLLVLTARVRADSVSRDSVEALLRDAMRLSRRLDEVAGNEPARGDGAAAVGAQTAQAPADWYPDPKGEKRLRYWDGDRWTDHTAD